MGVSVTVSGSGSTSGRGRPRSRWLFVAAGMLCLAMVSLVGQAGASSVRVRLSRVVGPPTAPLTVRVSGLQAGEPIGVLFDKQLLGKGGADAGGRFVLETAVPRSARPGRHEVVAQAGAASGDQAKAQFLVRANWS